MKLRLALNLGMIILLACAQAVAAAPASKKKHRSAELKSFVARNDNGRSMLEWETSSRDRYVYFMIEKSTDGVNYSSISQVNAPATRHASDHYIFVDNTLITAKTYYRILQADTRGTFDYAAIRPVVEPAHLSVSK